MSNIVNQAMNEHVPMFGLWEYANDSPVWLRPRRMVYFLVRHIGEQVQYRNDKRGRLITYNTRERAISMATKLNQQKGL